MKPKPTRKEPFLFEELEPRVLFSADLAPGLADLEPLDESALEDIAREATLHEHTIAAESSPAAPASSPDLAEAEHRTELVFVDPSTPDSEQLLNDLLTQSIDGRPMDVVVLDAEREGIAQMTEILSSYDNLDAVHIVSHGNETGVQLGATFLELGNLAEHSADIESWRSALGDEADLLFYGCDLAGGESGRALIGAITGLTGADVAASDDPTGSALLGGDWDLEYHVGQLESHLALSSDYQQQYAYVLASADIGASEDTNIKLGQPATNFGSSASMVIDRESGDLQRALVKFDLSSLPALATINSATLTMEATQVGGALNIAVYEVLESWDESNATWNDRATGMSWTTAGGHVSASAVATINTSSTGQHVWDITSLVQNWYSGSKVNNGLMVASPDGGGNRTATYDSSEGTAGPVLHIDYVTDIPVQVNNTGSELGQGAMDTITAAELRYDDAEPPTSVTYAVTGGPANGQLELTTNLGVAITSFTQDDIDNGRVVYVHNGSATTSDAFGFDVDDGLGNVTTGQSFSFTIHSSAGEASLWMSTVDNSPDPSGAPGLNSWTDGEVLEFGGPTLSLEPGTTTGTFTSQFDIDTFASSGTDIRGLHYVTEAVTVGTGITMDLRAGDVLFNIEDDSITLTSNNSVLGMKRDVIVFRPDVIGDYSLGTFTILLDDPIGKEIGAFSLVEKDTLVGDTVLNAGTFVLAENGKQHIDLFTAIDIGETTTTGNRTSQFIAGGDVDVDKAITGLELIEDPVAVGGATLQSGNILVSVAAADSDVGNQPTALPVTHRDIFVLDVFQTTTGSGTADANATLLFEGLDVGLDDNKEALDALTLYRYVDTAPPEAILNTGSTVLEGDTDTLSLSELRYEDQAQPGTSVTFTVTNSPINGQLELTGNPGVAITSFTQDDINNNRVVYVHDHSNTTSDSFDFDVDDGQGNTLAGQSFSISVTPVDDDAPTQATNAGSTVVEGGTDTLVSAEVRYTDSEQPATSVTYTVTTSPVNGQLELTGNPGVAITSFTQDDIDNNRVVYVHDSSNTTSDSFDFDVDDGQGNTLTAQSFSITITPENDAPVLDPAGNMTLTPTLENFTDPAGDLVSAIIASAGGDRITDADSGAVEGIAVTAVDDTNGTWDYSIDGGSNWVAFGTVSDGSAVLLTDTANDRIRFVPDPGFSGSADITFRAWDRTDGNPTGSTGVSTLSNGGSTPFSTATESAAATVWATETGLWLSSTGDVTASGTPGITDWSAGTLLEFGNPNFALGDGTTDGTFQSVVNLDGFAADSDVQLTGIHQVRTDVTVGSTNSVDLFGGDLLLIVGDNETLTSTNSLAVTAGDVILFRPGTPGNYSVGTFTHLLDAPGANQTTGISLVETDTLVGDVTLDAGTFLFTQSGNVQKNKVYHFTADDVGPGTTSGTSTVLIEGDDIGISGGGSGNAIIGVELIEDQITIGGVTLNAGNLLLTLDTPDNAVGDNSIAIDKSDAFALHVTTTTMGTGTTAANASIVLHGIDVGLDGGAEEIDGVSLFFRDTTNDPPMQIANAGTTVAEGGTDTLTPAELRYTDPEEPATSVTYTVTTSPLNGQLELTGNPGVAITSFTQDDIDNNRVVYVHDHSNTTSDSFDFDVDDGQGNTLSAQSFSITVTPVDDDAPTQTTNAGSTVAEGGTDTLISAEVLYTDSEQPATSVTYTVTTNPVNGQLELTAVPGVAITSFTQDDIDNNRVVYVHDHSNTTSDAFNFDVDDGQGNTLSAQSFSITVTPVDDDAPTQTTNAGSTVAEGGTETLISAEVLYTDSEQPATSVTYTVTTSPANGQLELTGNPGVAITSFTQDDIDNNRVVYVHDHSNTTSDAFDFDVDDGQGNTLAGQSFSITVTPVDDDAPTQTTNAGSTVAEGGTETLISAEVLYTDSEQPATSVTYTVTTSPANGQLELTGNPGVAITSFTQDDIDNNRVVYVHDHSNTTSDAFDFDVDDGQGNTLAGQSFSITVTPVDDDAPTQTTNAGSTVAEGGTDTLISAEVLYTDSEQPATSVTYTVTTSPANGQLELTGNPGVAITSFTQDDIDNNRVVYIHDHSNTTSDAFNFDVDDGQGNTLSAQSFSITVTPVDDDAPTQTTNAGSTVAEGGTDTLISAEVLYTDSEQPATSVTYTVTTVPANGQLELTGNPGVAITSFTQDDIDNNRVVYVHDHSNTTSDAFDFDVDDGQGNTLAGQSFSITVTPVDDDAPTQTTNAGSTVAEGGTETLISAEVLYTDSEQPATSVTYTVTTSPANGQLELTGNPGVAITSFTQDDIDNNRVVYVHDHSNTTSDAFDFDVDDGQGNTLAGQSFSITVTPVDDDAPTQTTNAGSTVAEGGTETLISAEVLYTDSEQPATSVTYTVTTSPANGQLELTGNPGVAITSFTQDDIDNNRVVYVHDHSNTTSDSFDFDVDDGQGNTLSAQSFSITVTPVDDDAPTQTTNAGSTVAEGGTDTLISAEVLYTDSEQPATSVTYTVTTNPVNGQLELTAVPGVAITSFTQDDIDNNRVVYVHDHSNTTSDAFDFDVDDGQGNTLAGQSFSITVTPVDDDAPTQTTNAGSTVAEGGTDTLISAEVLYTDSEQPATSVTYTVTTNPVNGQLELTAVPGVAITSFTQDDIDNNRVVYVHDHSNTSSDAFDFDVDDGQGNTLAGQSFSITVTPVDDDAPTQTTNAGSTVAEGGTDTLISAEVLYTDSEQPATSVTYTVTTSPANGQLELTGNPGVAITSFTQDDIDNNRVVYVHDHSNTTSDSFDFNVDDGQGNTLAGQSFSITVTPVDDDAPTQTTNAGSTVAEGGTDTLISAELLYTDSEQPATSVTYTVTTSPANGQLELTAVPGVAITSFTQDDIDNNRVVYIHDHSNTTSDAFDFDVDDGQGNTLSGQSFSITVTPVDDDAPTQTTNAGSTVAEGGTDTLISAEVLYTDSEQPATSVTYTVTTSPTNGQLELTAVPGVAITSFTQDDIDNNRVVYIHDHSNTTSDSFDFDVDDGQGNTLAGQSFSITVTPVDDDAPAQTTNAGSTVAEGGTDTLISAEVLYTDSEQPATSVTYTVTTVPSNGQLELTAVPGVAITSFTQDDIDNNRVVYVHDHSNTTSDSFDFNVDDGQGNTLAGQSFSITVTPVDDDAPTQTTNAGSTVAEGGTDTLISAEVLYTDSEQPATSVTYTVTTSPANGQLELTGNPGVAITSFTQDDIDNNRVVYVHDHSNTTSDSFDFDVDDGQGNTLAGQSFSITVTPVDDDAPTQTTNAGSTVAEGGTDTLISTEVLYTDSEQPATSVTYTVTTGPANGQLELTAVPGVAIVSFTQDDIDNNRVVYVHDSSNTTSDSFDFNVDDGQGNFFLGQSFAITVTPVNDTPTTSGFADVTVNEDAPPSTLSVFGAFDDSEDPDPALAYTLTANTNPALFSSTPIDGAAGTLTLNYAANANGSADITVRATDTAGAFVETTFNVTLNPVNDAPTLSANAGLSLDQGDSLTLANATLAVSDIDNNAAQIAYTLSALPAHGSLELNGSALGLGGSFTQDDIDNGRLAYAHAGAPSTSDTFTFSVDDGAGGTLGPISFSVTIEPTPELPSPPPVDPPPDPGDVPDPAPVDLDEPVEEPEEPAPEEASPTPGEATGLEDLDPGSTPTEGFVLPGLSPSEDADTPERQRASAPIAAPAPPPDLARAAAKPDQVLATDSEKSADVYQEVSALSLALDEMQNQMDEAVELEEVHHEMLLNAARGGGIALTAGYLSWLFRAGTLLASALSTMPVWTKFDPLPILAAPKRRRAAYPARNIEDEEDADRAVDRMFDGTKSKSLPT